MSNKAIFLDRDDTIIEDSGYINSPEQVKLLAGAAGAIADFKKMGYKLVVVSNQSGIARGIVTENAIGQIHERLKQLLAEQNAYLDRIYYCPYHPDGAVQKFRKDSDWRKPKPGMLLAASKEMNIALSDSWMIGNTYQDIAAGKTAGCRTILIKPHLKLPVKKHDDPDANFEAVNLREAVNIIKRETMPKPVVAPPAAAPTPAAIPAAVPQPEPEPQLVEPAVQPLPIQIEQAPVWQQQIEREEITPMPIEPKEEKQIEEPKAVEAIEEKPQQKPAEDVEFKVSAGDSSKTEKLLEEIRLLMKSRNRQELYTDFSVFKLFAGFMQVVVLACLFIALRYKMSPTAADSAVYTALGFAIVFQIMTLTLYIMHRDK
jgi:D,D-heptose 1,7-bisphosphate phosphatase